MPVTQRGGESESSKPRALFLAALVLLSVLATPAWTGIAAAAGNTSAGNTSVTSFDLSTDDTHTYQNVTVTATVENTGNSAEQHTVEVLSHSSYGDTHTLKTKTVTVDPGKETVPVNVSWGYTHVDGVSVDTLSLQPITVTENPISETQVDLSATSVSTGGTVTATVSLKNEGNTELDKNVELKNGLGRTVDRTTVTLASGATKDVSLSGSLSIPGTHGVRVNGQPSQKVLVDDSAISVDEFDHGTGTIYTDQSVTLTATVNNTAGKSKQFLLSGWADGSQVAGPKVVRLDPGKTKQVPLSTRTFRNAGTYNVTVNGQPTKTLTVEERVETTGYSVGRTTAKANQNVSVEVALQNQVSSQQTHTVEVERNYGGDWFPIASEEVALTADEQRNVTLNVSFDYPDTYSIRVADHSPTDVSVTENPVEVDDTTTSATSVSKGTTVATDVTLANTGSGTTARLVTLEKNGRTVAQREVDVAAGATETVSLDTTFDVGGVHSLGVGSRDATKVTVAEPDVSVTGYTLSMTSAYIGDPITVTATVENTAGAKRYFAVSAWDDSDVQGRPDVVELGSGETKQVTFEARFHRPGTNNLTVNGLSPTGVTIREGVTVVGASLSKDIVETGETFSANVVLENPTGSDRTKHVHAWAGESHSKQVTVPSNSRKTVSFPLNFSQAGKQWVFLQGETKTVVVLDDTTGTANVSVRNAVEPGTVVNNSTTYFPTEVVNDGDADGVADVSLVVDGTTVASDGGYVPAGGSNSVHLRHTFNETGTKTVEFRSGGTTVESFDVEVREEVITSDPTITHVGGTKPTTTPNVNAEFQRGFIDFRITNGQGGSPQDLSRIGVDDTTVFEVELTVEDYEPRVLASTGRDLNVTTSPGPDPNETTVTVRVRAAAIDFKTNFTNGYPDGPADWDSTVQNDTADFHWDAAVLLGMGNAQGDFFDADPSDLDGMTVSTDAQLFDMPVYYPGTDERSPRLEIPIAAPHETVDGSVNEGYYEAFLPDSLLDAWGVTDPESELTGAYSASENATLTVTEVDGGARVNVSLHYSSGTVTIEPDTSSSGSRYSGSSSSATPTPTPTAVPIATSTAAPTATPSSTTTATAAVTPTATSAQGTAATPTAVATQTQTPVPTADDDATPTESASPGFGPVVTVVALLAALAALAALRRE